MVYNTTTTQYTLNDLNQLTQLNAGATQYNYYYDTNGNLTTQRQTSANSTTYFTYDREDRLVQWQYYNPSTTVNYIYCGLGKRVMKVYNNNTALFFFDGLNTILEKYKAYNWSSFSTSQVYTLAPGVVGHIISKRLFVGAPQDLYYHYDPIGNVMFITDSYGNITVSYVQEGFGNVVATSGSAFDSYHLTTKERDHDPNTGLYYFGARWYDPVVGRFISKALYPAELEHPYSYAENNPFYFVDLDGENPILAILAIIADAGLEAGLSALDIYSTIETWKDPEATIWEKIGNTGLTGVGLICPTGGYAAGSKALRKASKAAEAAIKYQKYLKKVEDMKAGLARIKALKIQLAKATGPKTRNPILKELADEEAEYQRHVKRMKQEFKGQPYPQP